MSDFSFILPTEITDAILQSTDVPEAEYDAWVGGTGVFAALNQTPRSWRGMAVAPNGDVYACVYGGDIYKQAGGIGDFVALNQTTRSWYGMAAAPNGDVYACETNGDIYKSAYVPVYSQEDQVIKNHVIYESLTNNNKNNDPETDTTNWLEVGPTNRWACFDGTIGNQSTQAESMTYILAPGEVDSLALLNLESTSVRVDVVDDDNTADALVLMAMGARALGFPVEPSPQRVTPSALDAVKWPTNLRRSTT